MKKFLLVMLASCTFVTVDAQRLLAWVMFEPVQKGQVPWMVRDQALRAALLEVPPLGGTSTVGSWNNCTLYYRGTEESLQRLLDKLQRMPNVQTRVSIDQTGKLGRAQSTKFRPLPAPLIYQFSVAVSGHPMPNQGSEHVSIVIHKSSQIDPAKLRLPKPKTQIIQLTPSAKLASGDKVSLAPAPVTALTPVAIPKSDSGPGE